MEAGPFTPTKHDQFRYNGARAEGAAQPGLHRLAGEALNKVDGINIRRKGAIDDDVVLRGFQKDNINVLIDGVRVNGACPDRMDPPLYHYDQAVKTDKISVV